MKTLLAAAALFAASPAVAQPAGSYRALGTEPFWSLAIEGGRIVYEDAEGRRLSVATPRPRPMRLGRRYATPRLTVTILRGQRCSDGMSDRLYGDTVRVRVDKRLLSGCGGAILPPVTLANTVWEMVTIDGRAVPGGQQYRIEFGADRISGRAGCNQFSGTYRLGRDGFQAGPLGMTRMACPGPAMQHEQAVGRILASRVRLTYPSGDLLMRGPAGEVRLKRVN